MASPATLTQRSVDYLKRNYRYLVEDPSYFWMKTLARFELARGLAKRASFAPSASRSKHALGRASEETSETTPPEPTRGSNAETPTSTTTSFATPEPSSKTPRVRVDHGSVGALAILESEGYYVGLRLTQETLTGLLSRVQLATCYGDGEFGLPFQVEQRKHAEERYARNFKRGSYLQQHEHWPEFCALREDACLLAIAERYLGCVPVYLRSEISWGYPRPRLGAQHVKTAAPFQCEIQDFRSLTFGFYLTDVGSGDGPHSYIKKNPRQRPLSHQLLGQHCAELSEQRLTQTYGSEQIVTIYGPKGLGYVGDPYYLHRSSAPTQREHLLLQIEMGTRRYRLGYH